VKTIWKYPLQPDVTTLDMPQGAQVLTVQVQGNRPVLWALVDPCQLKRKRRFAVFGTGHDIPDEVGKYIGTFQLLDGGLVFHLFEVL
jgi:hypothetical protein